MDLTLTAATELTSARFLGDVELTRDGDTVSVHGRQALRGLYSWRERIGGAMLLTGSVAMVVAANSRNLTQATLATVLIVGASLVYVLGYLLLWLTSQETVVRFDQSSVHWLEVRAIGVGLLPRPEAAVRPRRVSFNVIDERLRATGYDLLVEDDDELVRLAALLARRDGPSVVRM